MRYIWILALAFCFSSIYGAFHFSNQIDEASLAPEDAPVGVWLAGLISNDLKLNAESPRSYRTVASVENACPDLSARSACEIDSSQPAATARSFKGCALEQAKVTGRLRTSLENGQQLHCGIAAELKTNAFQLQWTNPDGNPGEAALFTDRLTWKIDHAPQSGTLYNFDGQTILPTIGQGFGTSVSFDDSHRRVQISTAEHLSAVEDGIVIKDQSVFGTLNLAEREDLSVPSGSLQLYLNKYRVVASSAFSEVVYKEDCCLPVAGTIVTSFKAGQNVAPTEEGQRLVGRTETVRFTGCGMARASAPDGQKRRLHLQCF